MNPKGQAKTGRKGDPRMHRAVAARMENPELSLFEALRIGGFDYPADEDASIMDAEKVTLGQRKNQLSRRLRLARKQQEEQNSRNGGGVGVGGANNNNNLGGGGVGGMMQQMMNDGGLNAKMKFQHQLQQQQQQQQQQFGGGGGVMGGGPGGSNNNNNNAMSSEAQRQLEKLMQHSHHAKLSSGVKRNHAAVAGLELGPDAEIHPGEEEAAGLMDEKNARRMQAKFHPQYQPLFISRARSSFTSGSGAGAGASGSGGNSNSLLGSGTTPQLGPLAAPLASLGAPSGLTLGGPSTTATSSSSAAPPSAAATNPSSLFPGSSGTTGGGGGQLGSITSTLAQPRTASSTSASTTTPTASGVAIASLSSTAQTVGLTLEQLAVALSSSSNLVKVLSNNSGSEQQQELALRLFRNESRALYQRCMLLAGCRPEDAEEKSQNHLQFAFSAWQMEGKRLQELMGSSNDNGSASNNNGGATSGMKLGGGMNHSMGAANQQQQDHQHGGHSHSSHGHGHGHGAPSHKHDHHHHNANGGGNNNNNNGSNSSSNNNNNNPGGGQQTGHHEHSHAHSSSQQQSHHSHSHHSHHDHGHDHGHVHQLEGKCGHKAIIHQPKDGAAHIDFLVGDKVECYHGVQPGTNKSMGVAWPSATPQAQLSSSNGNSTDQQQQQQQNFCDDEHCELDLNNLANNNSNNQAPKLLDISDLDLTGAEWNSDLNGSMGGTLLGLFKLGDADKDDDVTPTNNGGGGGGSSTDGDFGISV